MINLNRMNADNRESLNFLVGNYRVSLLFNPFRKES